MHAPGRGKGAQQPWQHPLRPPGRAVRRRQALPVLERHPGLKDPRRPASLMHACIVVSPMAGVRPEEARAIGWEEAGAETSRPSRRCPASSRQREPPGRCLRHQRAAWLVRSPPDRGSLRSAGLLSRRDTPLAVAPAGRAGRAGRVRRPGGTGRRRPAESPARTRLLVSSAMISASPAAMPSMASLATAAGSDLGTSRWRVMSVSMYATCRAVTRVPCGASSRRRALVSDHSADLAAQ